MGPNTISGFGHLAGRCLADASSPLGTHSTFVALQRFCLLKRWKIITPRGGLALAWPLASYEQHSKPPLKRVGVLTDAPCPTQLTTGMKRGRWFTRLSELGWAEGKTIVFDCVSTVGR